VISGVVQPVEHLVILMGHVPRHVPSRILIFSRSRRPSPSLAVQGLRALLDWSSARRSRPGRDGRSQHTDARSCSIHSPQGPYPLLFARIHWRFHFILSLHIAWERLVLASLEPAAGETLSLKRFSKSVQNSGILCLRGGKIDPSRRVCGGRA